MRLMVSFSRSCVFYELDFPTLFLALHPSLYLFHMVALESFNYVGTGFYCCIICFRVGRIHTYLEPMKVSSNGNMHTWILLILFSRFCSFTSYFCSKCPVCLHGSLDVRCLVPLGLWFSFPSFQDSLLKWSCISEEHWSKSASSFKCMSMCSCFLMNYILELWILRNTVQFFQDNSLYWGRFHQLEPSII